MKAAFKNIKIKINFYKNADNDFVYKSCLIYCTTFECFIMLCEIVCTKK